MSAKNVNIMENKAPTPRRRRARTGARRTATRAGSRAAKRESPAATIPGALPLPPGTQHPPFRVGVPRRRFHPLDTPPPSAEKSIRQLVAWSPIQGVPAKKYP